MTSLIVIGLLVALALFVIGIYNRLVSLRNGVKNGFAQIEVQLTRRYDLIPNLVEAVKGYMAHERETLEEVIQARNQAVGGLKAAAADPSNPAAMKQLIAAEAGLGGVLGRLFALAEAYPDLKANENMIHLQAELTDTENQLATSRQGFNDRVQVYNTACETFPNNLIANTFSFQPAEFLEIDDPAKREAPQVSFS